ncbi:MAG: hypothetical protein ACFFCP_11140 [Promethearchaeota archaeon]
MSAEAGGRNCEEILDDPNRGRLVLSLRRVIRNPVHFLRITDPFITAHHPICGYFDGHSISIRGRKWCIGCTFNSISFFGAALVLLTIWSINPGFLNRFYLFWGGVIGSIIYFIGSISGLVDRGSLIKVASKFLLGSSFASICWSILLLNGLLSPGLEVKLIIILILYLGFVTVLNVKRSHEIFQKCRDCEYKMRWSKCPGFRSVVCRLIEEGFVITQDT